MTPHHHIVEKAQHTTRRSKPRWSLVTRAVVSAMVLSVALLGATLACRAEDPANVESTNTTTEEPLLDGEIDLEEGIASPPKIKAKYVKRGAEVQINARSNTVWVVIPSRYFSKVDGGSDWAIGEEMIAFKIDHGIARVKLSKDFPASNEDQSVYYSILFFDGKNYAYQEGQSPPRMIIPPGGF